MEIGKGWESRSEWRGPKWEEKSGEEAGRRKGAPAFWGFLRALGPAPSSVTPGAWNPRPPPIPPTPPSANPGPERRAHLPLRPSPRVPSPAPRAPPPRDGLCRPDRWWGAQLVRYQPPPGASLSRSAAACLRLGPPRVIKRRPGPSPASFPALIWPVGQVGTSDKDWGLQQFWGRQPLAPCPLSGQEQEGGGRKVSASPAPARSSHHPGPSCPGGLRRPRNLGRALRARLIW